MLTRAGICYDLSESPYKFETESLIFYFSSKLHMNKFIKEYKTAREFIRSEWEKRAGVKVNFDKVSDVCIYRKIETRGYRVEKKEGGTLWKIET